MSRISMRGSPGRTVGNAGRPAAVAIPRGCNWCAGRGAAVPAAERRAAGTAPAWGFCSRGWPAGPKDPPTLLGGPKPTPPPHADVPRDAGDPPGGTSDPPAGGPDPVPGNGPPLALLVFKLVVEPLEHL